MGRESFRFQTVVSQTAEQKRTRPYTQQTHTFPQGHVYWLASNLGGNRVLQQGVEFRSK